MSQVRNSSTGMPSVPTTKDYFGVEARKVFLNLLNCAHLKISPWFYGTKVIKILKSTKKNSQKLRKKFSIYIQFIYIHPIHFLFYCPFPNLSPRSIQPLTFPLSLLHFWRRIEGEIDGEIKKRDCTTKKNKLYLSTKMFSTGWKVLWY